MPRKSNWMGEQYRFCNKLLRIMTGTNRTKKLKGKNKGGRTRAHESTNTQKLEMIMEMISSEKKNGVKEL